MGVSVGRCLKQNMAIRRQGMRGKVWLDQDQECAKLDMKQAIAEFCALDGEGHAHWERGAEHKRAKVGVENLTGPTQDIERDGESQITGI